MITPREMFTCVYGAIEVLDIPPQFKEIVKLEVGMKIGLDREELQTIETELDKTMDYLLSNIMKSKEEGEFS